MQSHATEGLRGPGTIKMSTYIDTLPREKVEYRHCRARFWLPNCFIALVCIYIHTWQIDCV